MSRHNELHLKVAELQNVEDKERDLRFEIVEILISEKLHGYFSVNWSKLKRDMLVKGR